jgi:lipopolysaccharide export system permease protein
MKFLWQRLLLKEISGIFLLFLFGFFTIYALIDYSLHMQDFIKDQRIQFFDLLIYYFHQFVKRSPLLVPLALLIATIKVLCGFNASRELVALQAGGISLRRLMTPFFLVATLCSLYSAANAEFLLPRSLNYADQFHKAHFRHSMTGNRKERLHVLTLKDNSKLIYQTYNREQECFSDVVWIRSADDVWRMKLLKADPKNPEAKFVDHLVRNGQGIIEKGESFETYLFHQMQWKPEATNLGTLPVENRKISSLYRLLFEKKETTTFEKSELLTQFLYKSSLPFLPFLVVIGVAPFCIRYTRQAPLFFIYSFSLFGFIAFYMLMDAATILGENQVLSPWIAVLAPSILCASFFTFKFVRMR